MGERGTLGEGTWNGVSNWAKRFQTQLTEDGGSILQQTAPCLVTSRSLRKIFLAAPPLRPPCSP